MAVPATCGQLTARIDFGGQYTYLGRRFSGAAAHPKPALQNMQIHRRFRQGETAPQCCEAGIKVVPEGRKTIPFGEIGRYL